MSKLVDSIEKFDISKKKSLVILFSILIIWGGVSAVIELTFPYEDCKSFGKKTHLGSGLCTDYGQRLHLMYRYEDTREEFGGSPLRIVTYELLYLSNNVFGDYRIIPFISSGFLLLLTYFITFEITKRNYTGLVAVLFVLQSSIFWKYDLVMTYPNFWCTFFLFSIYSTFKVWQLSPVSFGLGLVAKILNFLNLPAILIFTYLTKPKAWKKIIVTYLSLVGGLIGGLFVSKFVHPAIWNKIYFIFLSQFSFQPVEFLWWLGMWSIELFTDKITLFMIFILLPCLFILKKQKVRNASAILAMILIFILQPAFISGFTYYTNEDYRYIHLVVFVGIGGAFILSNLKEMITGFGKFFNVKI